MDGCCLKGIGSTSVYFLLVKSMFELFLFFYCHIIDLLIDCNIIQLFKMNKCKNLENFKISKEVEVSKFKNVKRLKV